MSKLRILMASAMLLASASAFSANNPDEGVYQNVPVNEAQKLIEQYQGNAQFELIDVRTTQEFEQAHINGARKIDFYSADFQSTIKTLDREKSYLVYCRSGNRSSKTLALMKQLGFKKVYNMQGGIIDWHQQKLPLEIEK